jgi:transcriptional regulator with PAS, ATPase and Fis domain
MNDSTLPFRPPQSLPVSMGLKEISQAAADLAMQVGLEQEEGNLQRAAKRLGVTDRALQMRRANRRQIC